MNDVCKDLVEEVIEFDQPGEPVESAINACEGRTETSSHATLSRSIKSMAREGGLAWHETLEQPRQAQRRAKQAMPWSTTIQQDDNDSSSCGTVDL